MMIQYEAILVIRTTVFHEMLSVQSITPFGAIRKSIRLATCRGDVGITVYCCRVEKRPVLLWRPAVYVASRRPVGERRILWMR